MVAALFTLLSVPPSAIDRSSARDPEAAPQSSRVVPLDGEWLLAVDPDNAGRDEQWWESPAADARVTRVPWIIQDVFPEYYGVAWYWRDCTPPANAHEGGRYVLRFWNVDYIGDVWVNGTHVGHNEGDGVPFELDVTDAARPEVANRVAVRVLNPTDEPIDGITLPETTRWAKNLPYSPGLVNNFGGIIDSVELLVVPAMRVEDLFVRPDPQTGTIEVDANVRNSTSESVPVRLELGVGPAAGGGTLNSVVVVCEAPPGDSDVSAELAVEDVRLWELNDPYLYRVTVRVSVEGSGSFDEQSVRCGFREFRFENGYFRLNGRRIFLKGAQTDTRFPMGVTLAHDPDLPRRDLLNAKTIGMNFIRSFGGKMTRDQLEVCDEIGLLVYQEQTAAWRMEPSPQLPERFNRAVAAIVKRDRNHACIVMWGLLNETAKGEVFDHAVTALPVVRELDETRMVLLNSAGWDHTGMSHANPGVMDWETTLSDQHPYKEIHNADVIREMRTLDGDRKPIFITEYGIGSAVDLPRIARHFEWLGNTTCQDAVMWREFLDRFMDDWHAWKMDEAFVSPEDYFAQCVAWMADMRKLGTNAFRSNPNVIGQNITGLVDPCVTGEGMTATFFRELKPGVVDAMFDAFAPLRWCLFVEPTHVYRGREARFEAVLANEDQLAPGDYPVRLQVVGPDKQPVLDRTISVRIPDPKGTPEPAFALPVFAEDVVIDGPSGRYRFLVAFLEGAAAAGGEIEFYVADGGEMPSVEKEVVLWGDDADLEAWLDAHRIRTSAFAAGPPAAREVILVGESTSPAGAEEFRELARHLARGSHVVFLSPDVFKRDDDATGWLPLTNKGDLVSLRNGLYHKDDWAKDHPIFEGLPTRRVWDHTFYREMIPTRGWSGQDAPAEAVAGSIGTSLVYVSSLLVAVYRLGAGGFTLNTLPIREALGEDPVAERLLRNMLRHAAHGTRETVAELPADFNGQLEALGY